MEIFVLSANWWAFIIRGLLAIAFGLLAFFMPGLTLLGLVLLFGSYAIVEGIFNIVGAFRANTGQPRWWVLLLEGLVSIACGIIAFFLPLLTALALLYVISAWAVVTGVLKIIAAIRLRQHVKGEWILALSGVLSIALGVLLVWRPGVGVLALVWWIGGYAIAFGALLLALGIRLRHLERAVDTHGDLSHAVPGH